MYNNAEIIGFTWPDGPIPDEFDDLKTILEQTILEAKFSLDVLSYTYNTDTSFDLNRCIQEVIALNKPSIRIVVNDERDARRMRDSYSNLGSEIKCYFWNPEDNDKSKFHIKSILIDKRYFYLGSANISETAMTASAECGIIRDNRQFAGKISKYIDDLIEAGRLLVA